MVSIIDFLMTDARAAWEDSAKKMADIALNP